MAQARTAYTLFYRVNRISGLVAHLQLASVLASVIAHHFCFPFVRYGQIVHEEISPVRLGNDQGADNVLIRFHKAYVPYSKAIAVPKVYFDFFLVGKVVPKFTVTTELQTFHNFILSAWIKLCVQRFYRIGNLGLKYAAFVFQPMYYVFRLCFYKVIVLCGQILLPKRKYGNCSVLVPREQPRIIVSTIKAYFVHLLYRFEEKQNRLSVRKPTLHYLFDKY